MSCLLIKCDSRFLKIVLTCLESRAWTEAMSFPKSSDRSLLSLLSVTMTTNINNNHGFSWKLILIQESTRSAFQLNCRYSDDELSLLRLFAVAASRLASFCWTKEDSILWRPVHHYRWILTNLQSRQSLWNTLFLVVALCKAIKHVDVHIRIGKRGKPQTGRTSLMSACPSSSVSPTLARCTSKSDSNASCFFSKLWENNII